MQRQLRLAAGLAVVLLAAACGEVPTSAPSPDGFQRVEASASIVPGTCTNLGQLNTLAATIFTPGSSPNISSVKGKLKNLDKTVRQGRIADAKAHATEIVAFTLKKYNQGGLSGSSAQVEEFTNAILCFAGFDLEVEQPENTFLIMPSDLPQIVTNTDGNAGISFPGNPVSEPTLVEIELIPNIYPPGAGPLDTKLDQYPGYIQITKTSETNAPLTQPVVVGVCAAGAIPQEVRDRLRLGHGASAGFEVTPAASANFISCPNQVADAGATPLWKRLASALLPRQLHAYQQEAFGGGVGGTVTEFSPFAPVDPELSFGGGVGGTVTEFLRSSPFTKSSLMADDVSLLSSCSPIEGATGSPLRDECRPYVQLTTRLGTPFIGVPVTWNVTVGGGLVAPNPGTCGTLGATALTNTGDTGRSGICWTLGTVGANQVTATPSLGGDALEGVTFSPAVLMFDAVANPAAWLLFSAQPPSTVRAGVAFAAEVTVVDKNGERVHVSSDRVDLQLNQNSFINGITTASAKAVNGIARFEALPITTLGTGYRLLASAPFLTLPAVLPSSNLFDVIAGVPWTLVIEDGNSQSGVAGQSTAIAPRVRVTDRYGNAVSGVVVTWRTYLGTVSASPSQTPTDADGRASTTWTLGLGANELRALLSEGSFAVVSFQATGVAP